MSYTCHAMRSVPNHPNFTPLIWPFAAPLSALAGALPKPIGALRPTALPRASESTQAGPHRGRRRSGRRRAPRLLAAPGPPGGDTACPTPFFPGKSARTGQTAAPCVQAGARWYGPGGRGGGSGGAGASRPLGAARQAQDSGEGHLSLGVVPMFGPSKRPSRAGTSSSALCCASAKSTEHNSKRACKEFQSEIKEPNTPTSLRLL